MTNDDIQTLRDRIAEQDEEIFRLNYLIDSLPGCIYWKDVNGRYLGLNQFTVNRLQQVGIKLDKKDIINKTDFDIFDENTAIAYRDNDLEIIILLYVARIWKLEPKPIYHSEIKWVEPKNLRQYKMPPANDFLISSLQDLLI